MGRTSLFLMTIISLLWASIPAGASENAIEKVLPVPACAEGWTMDGKVLLYDRENLFDRIDGEAELYFPYGFEVLAYARYANRQNPQVAVDADVYKMGSLLDAFGMYASYRRNEDATVKIGAEGTVSASQLFFYQDRYLVRIQATGASLLNQDVFLACARAIAQNLPQNTGRPAELEAFAIPAVAQESERYYAQSLLGYDFFRRGLLADAVLHGEQVHLFLVPESSRDAARTSFDKYRSYLKAAGKVMHVTEKPDRISLKAVDPLYGNVVVEQTGRYVIGAFKVKDASVAQQLIDQLRKRVSDG